jgi:hypothetical protein
VTDHCIVCLEKKDDLVYHLPPKAEATYSIHPAHRQTGPSSLSDQIRLAYTACHLTLLTGRVSTHHGYSLSHSLTALLLAEAKGTQHGTEAAGGDAAVTQPRERVVENEAKGRRHPLQDLHDGFYGKGSVSNPTHTPLTLPVR